MTAIELVCPDFLRPLTEVDLQTVLHYYMPGVSSRTIPGVAAEPVAMPVSAKFMAGLGYMLVRGGARAPAPGGACVGYSVATSFRFHALYLTPAAFLTSSAAAIRLCGPRLAQLAVCSLYYTDLSTLIRLVSLGLGHLPWDNLGIVSNSVSSFPGC